MQFYDERLGAECVGVTSLIKWLKSDRAHDDMLRLKREQILVRDPGAAVEAQFPPTLHWQGVDYQLRYQFEPGRQNDGVSITIPLPLLNRAPRYLFDWLVPGLLRDKCIALIKGLPKGLRKQLVPAPDAVDAAPHGDDCRGQRPVRFAESRVETSARRASGSVGLAAKTA